MSSRWSSSRQGIKLKRSSPRSKEIYRKLIFRSSRNCPSMSKQRIRRNWFHFSRLKRICCKWFRKEMYAYAWSMISWLKYSSNKSIKKYINYNKDDRCPRWFQQIHPRGARLALSQRLEKRLGWCPKQSRNLMAWRSGINRRRSWIPKDVGRSRWKQNNKERSIQEDGKGLNYRK